MWRAAEALEGGRTGAPKNRETRRRLQGDHQNVVFPDREWRGLLEGVGQGLYSLFYGPLRPDRLCALLL